MSLQLNLILLIVLIFFGSALLIVFRKYNYEIFIGLWIFTPNLLTNPIGLYNIPLYSFAEVFFAISLLISAVIQKNNSYEINNIIIYRLILLTSYSTFAQ